MITTFYTQIESPLGLLLLVADDAGLRQILFVNGRHPAQPESSWKEEESPFNETMRQLQAYFAGELEKFDLKLAPVGTPFQLEVWRSMRHSLRRDCFLPRTGLSNWKSQSLPSRRPCQWLQPDSCRDSVPSRDR